MKNKLFIALTIVGALLLQNCGVRKVDLSKHSIKSTVDSTGKTSVKDSVSETVSVKTSANEYLMYVNNTSGSEEYTEYRKDGSIKKKGFKTFSSKSDTKYRKNNESSLDARKTAVKYITITTHVKKTLTETTKTKKTERNLSPGQIVWLSILTFISVLFIVKNIVKWEPKYTSRGIHHPV